MNFRGNGAFLWFALVSTDVAPCVLPPCAMGVAAVTHGDYIAGYPE